MLDERHSQVVVEDEGQPAEDADPMWADEEEDASQPLRT
jgi:hypothetical protein